MFDTSQSGLRDLTVLIVEDDFYIAQWLGDEISALGGEVKGPVSDVGSAKKIVEAEHIDFAILDVKLRDKLVFPLADLLLSRGIPYFFETGYDQHLVFPDCHAGAPRWVKPFSPRQFADALAWAAKTART